MPRHIMEAVSAELEDLTRIRRDIHAHPEVGYEEVRTASVVRDELIRLGLEVKSGLGITGLVATLTGQKSDSGRRIGLRADMDALPIREENEFSHRSTIEGKMHGCGHDGHTTILLAAARYLTRTRNFNGTVHFIFQPGEEGHAGARAMIEDGLFRDFPVDEIYALHNWPSLPPGVIGINPGPMMAGIDRFEVEIEGVGGHGAHPHNAIDPIVAASHFVTAAQAIVSRNVNPLDSAVVSFHSFQAGSPSALSVIPRVVRLSGMVKWYKPEVQKQLQDSLQRTADHAAATFGAKARLTYAPLYPPTINDPAAAGRVVRIAEALIGREKVLPQMEPSMGSEDFAFMLQQKPGAYFRLGQGGQEGCFLHNPRYDFNDEVIPLGAAVFAGLVEDAMPL